MLAGVGVVRLVSTAENAARCCRHVARRLEGPTPAAAAHEDAMLLRAMARALDAAARSTLVPEEPTEGASGFVGDLVGELLHPRALVGPQLGRWLASQLLAGRHLVGKLLGALEIYGTDVELVASSEAWARDVDKGPDV